MINEVTPRTSEWKRFQRVFFQRKVVLFGLIILIILVLTAIFAPLLAPYNPFQINLKESLQQPSWTHLLGTDLQGRDTLSRLIYGSRTALMVGFGSVLMAGIVGVSLGLIAGYVGGITNMIIMRIMDALMGFPMILLALVIAAVLGSGIHNVIIALSVATLPGYARVMHGLTLTIRENDYILAQEGMGASGIRTMFWHILPNGLPPMIVLITLQLGALILAEAGLSFLGVGIDPTDAAWGAMVADGRRYLLTYPWLSLAPGFAIMLVVFAFNLVGDGLRDALDPRLRGLL
ncbi:MAG: ABC transporter permease [Dehalococcoidia bacterium SG8_51_3]|nr:MAG: ABC transporter permease [Dehalococcoidia bacterium SG8_51_3]HEY96650.1 ABC transporter permease [Dehalococcoidia bacterium]